ncbi:MAG: mechanosensitive ion channel family protein [Moraxellaceae bacterium]|nr:mechanosensitive ion channel family protein [Moraxellaceae bacterium]
MGIYLSYFSGHFGRYLGRIEYIAFKAGVKETVQLSHAEWTSWLAIFDEWVAQVFVIVLVTLLVNFVAKRIMARMAVRFALTANPWDDAIVDALQKPLSFLIWLIGLTISVYVIKEATQQSIFAAAAPLRDLGIVFALSWFLYRLAYNVELNVINIHEQEDRNYDKTTAVALGKLVRLSLMITTTLVALQTLGISISGVLAFGGVGGIAIGFAARDLLANFFGALMVYWDRPFNVGDWIRSPDREIEGTVEDIGWRLTRIRTFDQRPLYVPNSIFTGIVVENPSRMANRRINETIAIRYADINKMAAIVEKVKAMLTAHPDIDTSKTLMVNFDTFNKSSVDFFIYTFTKTTQWVEFHHIKQDVLLKIADIVAQHEAHMAFPTTTLDLPPEFKKVD